MKKILFIILMTCLMAGAFCQNPHYASKVVTNRIQALTDTVEIDSVTKIHANLFLNGDIADSIAATRGYVDAFVGGSFSVTGTTDNGVITYDNASGNGVVESGATFDGSTLDLGDNDLNFTNLNISGTSSVGTIFANTSDASDNTIISIGGGGAISSSRGGYIQVGGNESATAGIISIVTGNAGASHLRLITSNGSSEISFRPNSTERGKFSASGIFSVDNIAAYTTNTNLALSGNGTGEIDLNDNTNVTGDIDLTGNIMKTGTLAIDATTGITLNYNSTTEVTVGSNQVTIQNAFDIIGNTNLRGLVDYGVGSEVTIATGSVTITSAYHRVDTEADAASDDLDTITATGLSAGMIVILRPANTTRTVVVKDGVGNIDSAGDFSMDNAGDTITLIYDGSTWRETSRSDNGS